MVRVRQNRVRNAHQREIPSAMRPPRQIGRCPACLPAASGPLAVGRERHVTARTHHVNVSPLAKILNDLSPEVRLARLWLNYLFSHA